MAKLVDIFGTKLRGLYFCRLKKVRALFLRRRCFCDSSCSWTTFLDTWTSSLDIGTSAIRPRMLEVREYREHLLPPI